jgi:hypothetical protein
MITNFLKIATLGLMGAIALNTMMPVMTSAKDNPKPAAQKSAPSIWEQLNLSKEQKTKLQGIRTRRTNAISKVLNKEQKATFDKLRGRKKLADILKELKLDASQQKAITDANQQAAKEIMAVLNKEQQKQLTNRKESAE